MKILTIDIGGSHIKATILDKKGKMTDDYERLDTPSPATPDAVLLVIQRLEKRLEDYDRISIGFPGFVKDGIVMTAPNLGTADWKGFALEKTISELFGKSAKLVNDADLQGLGVASGKGLEIVTTLGTGFGTAFLLNGKLLPHLELAHHPISQDETYDEYIGDKALDEIGEEEWNERMMKVLAVIKTVFNYDHLYLSGGNAKKIRFPLEDNMSIVTNKDGIKGGAKLWNDE